MIDRKQGADVPHYFVKRLDRSPDCARCRKPASDPIHLLPVGAAEEQKAAAG